MGEVSVIRWESPPEPKVSTQSRWRRIANELMTRPRDWAVVGEYPTAKLAGDSASLIRSGRRAGMPAGEFEAEVARTEDGHLLYARYVGHVI